MTIKQSHNAAYVGLSADAIPTVEPARGPAPTTADGTGTLARDPLATRSTGSTQSRFCTQVDILRENGTLDFNLPVIVVDTQGQVIPDEPKVDIGLHACLPSLNNGTQGRTDYAGLAGIEIRGSSSARDHVRKSFAVELRDEFGDDFKFPLLGALCPGLHARKQQNEEEGRVYAQCVTLLSNESSLARRDCVLGSLASSNVSCHSAWGLGE